MGFIRKDFDMKKLIQYLHKKPEEKRKNGGNAGVSPGELKPELSKIYFQIIRDGTIEIQDLDFTAFDLEDIDDLEYALEDMNALTLLGLAETFREFVPAASAKPVFI